MLLHVLPDLPTQNGDVSCHCQVKLPEWNKINSEYIYIIEYIKDIYLIIYIVIMVPFLNEGSFQDSFFLKSKAKWICRRSVAGHVHRFQHHAKKCYSACQIKHDPIFHLCKVVIKNQYQFTSELWWNWTDSCRFCFCTLHVRSNVSCISEILL